MQGAGLSPACRTSHPQGCVGAWHHPGTGDPIPGAPQDPQTPPCPSFGGEPASPCAQSTRAALPRPREMFGEGEKKKIPAAALGKPEDGFGALRLPLARGRLRAALHTPHPAPRPAAPGAVGFGRQQPLRNAERSHFAHSRFVHRGWALPRPPPRPAGAEGSKYRTHTPPPRIQPPPGRLPAASSSELY